MEISLAAHIRRFVPFSETEAQDLTAFVEVRSLGRRDHLFEIGADAGELAFVEAGLLRQYTVDDRARELTLQFGLEGWWMADWPAFEGLASASFAVQAVEASRLVVVQRHRFEPLLAALPVLERYFRQVFQRAQAAAHRRLHLSETTSGEQTYRRFCERYPEFVQRVPQSMLASFLGFTPEYLSKIRSRS